jgi:radical SAM protein with 4Fe4S-binding SPASM domain
MISKVWDIYHFACTIRLNKLVNALKLAGSYLMALLSRNPVQYGLPASISIETSAHCNLRCPECPSGSNKLARARGLIDIGLFKQLISRISAHAFAVSLYFQGEPMMHPEIIRLIREAVTKKLYVTIATNGHFLGYGMAKDIVSSGLQRIIVSLDGLTENTYSRYRKGGSYIKVVEGIGNVAEAKLKMKSRTPYIILQFLVMKHNEQEMEDFQSMARQLGANKVVFKTMQIQDLKKENPFIPSKHKFNRYKLSEKSPGYLLKTSLFSPCWRLWHSTVVTWDGRVVPCCFDKHAAHCMGNVGTELLKNIWHNKIYNEFRKTLFRQRNRIDICTNCTGSLFS